MIDNKSIQRALQAQGRYTGAIDGVLGRQSRAAVSEALKAHFGEDKPWKDDRKLVAYQQLMMKEVGIAVGEIDGLMGPQTQFALEQWQNRLRGVEPAEDEIDHIPTIWPRQKDVPVYFGEEGKSQVMLDLPYPMKLAWDLKTSIRRFQIHEKAHDSALRVLNRVRKHYGEGRIKRLGLDLFGGCLNVRAMRGGEDLSMHSWGIAIDFDPERNQLRWGKDRAQLAKSDYEAFWRLWEEEGWVSLGRERNYDWMHVQAARL